jgi:ATP adenylyltransferase
MVYLKSASKPKQGECIFCDKVKARRTQDRKNLVLHRGERAFVVMNLYPYTSGHLMVAPYEHNGELESLDGDTLKEMMLLVGASIRALRATMNPHGFNIGINLGRVAGAGVEDHVHIHIVPRWNGDTNFMPVFAEVRMIPELLPKTYDKLFEAFQNIAAPKQTRKK